MKYSIRKRRGRWIAEAGRAWRARIYASYERKRSGEERELLGRVRHIQLRSGWRGDLRSGLGEKVWQTELLLKYTALLASKCVDPCGPQANTRQEFPFDGRKSVKGIGVSRLSDSTTR